MCQGLLFLGEITIIINLLADEIKKTNKIPSPQEASELIDDLLVTKKISCFELLHGAIIDRAFGHLFGYPTYNAKKSFNTFVLDILANITNIYDLKSYNFPELGSSVKFYKEDGTFSVNKVLSRGFFTFEICSQAKDYCYLQ